jgi:tetratricopeptide (TPR) repeat protein
MIGFRDMGAGLRCAVAVMVGLLLAACAQPLLKGPEPKAPAESPAVPEAAPEEEAVREPVEPVAEPAPPEPAPPKKEPLSSSLLYDVLLGEIAGQRGMMDISASAYMEAARSSNDPRVAERALKIAVFGKQQELALEAARRWVELAPEDLEARQALAALALRTGDQQEALEQLEYLLRHGEDHEGGPYHSTLVLLAREPDTQLALDIMGQLVARRPDDPQAHFAYARLAVHAQNWTLAAQQIEESLKLRPDWTEALVLQAQIGLKQNQGEAARQRLAAALERYPENVELRLAYARLLVDLEQFELARAEYTKLLEQRPDDGQIVYSLALLALEAGQLQQAEELFKKLLKLDFETQQAYYYLGAIAEDQKEYQRAIRWYREIEGGDHWIEVQIRMARLEALQGELDKARERLRALRVAHPAQAQRLFLAEGEILSQVDRQQDAYRLYSDYLESQPEDTEILYARALVAERLDLLRQAERDFRAVLSQDPDNARALNALGYTLADRTQRYEEARVLIEKALAQTPDDPAVIDSMGWVLFRLGHLEEARQYLQRAYDMTGDAEIAAHLGEVMWVMGDRQAARSLWKKASESEPDDPVLKDALRRFGP